eukprot:TRINITY_DN66221_c0_g1_i1.p1 TRINITY_DN66221_c0_g1~~TRINITY_DN66221_c0_g1_i1.p1  ORF type:complete len:346 (-),score=45.44 TRINITY_DN66221_c0_g1_i1:441-1337(-)
MAIENDLRAIKSAGFNTVRVHAVVMGAPFYALCDSLGLLVWQDMPGGDQRAMPTWSDDRGIAEEDVAAMMPGFRVPRSVFDEVRRTAESKAAFHKELSAMVAWLAPFASVIVWTLFNEGWGQFDTRTLVNWLRQADASRLVNAVSGWNEVEGEPLGDFADVHNYEDNSSAFGQLPETFVHWARLGNSVGGRVPVLGEYGGLGFVMEGHEWKAHESWGYGNKVRRDVASYREDLHKLLERLLPTICGGLSAAIYTQWNDVETEMNGLLTYDRHWKLPLEVVQDYSRKVFDALPQCQTSA